MNEIITKNEIIDTMFDYEYVPVEYDKKYMQKAIKIPVSELSALGTTFSTLSESVRTVTQTTAGSGEVLYRALNLGQDAMAKDKVGQLLGQVKDENLIQRNVRFQPVSNIPTTTTTVMPINPATMYLAAAMLAVDKKLDAIQEGQQDIMFFMEQQEEAKLIGDINLLNDLAENYKFNCENEQYISNQHMKVLDIKQDAEQSIQLWRSEIENAVSKKKFLHGDVAANVMIEKTIKTFASYHRALYLFSYSTFLDVMLLKTFNETYLNNIAQKLSAYSKNYNELYQKSYDQIKEYLDSSIESSVLEVAGDLNRNLGNFLEDIPYIKELTFGDAMQGVGNRILNVKEKKNNKLIDKMHILQNVQVRPFVESLNTVNNLYNNPQNVYFDKNNIYLLAAGEDHE